MNAPKPVWHSFRNGLLNVASESSLNITGVGFGYWNVLNAYILRLWLILCLKNDFNISGNFGLSRLLVHGYSLLLLLFILYYLWKFVKSTLASHKPQVLGWIRYLAVIHYHSRKISCYF